MTFDFTNRHVVVTGATGELGRVVVERLLGSGAVCHLPVRAIGKLGDLLAQHVGRVHVREGFDPTDERSVAGFYADLPELWASVHCLGAFGAAPIADSGIEEWNKLLSINAASAFLCCRHATLAMRRTGGGGRLVNVAARVGCEPRLGAGMAAYAASKAAVVALSVALAEELRHEGILVNAIAPSVMDTPANRAARPADDASGWPTLADAARAISFLASAGNCAVQGAVLPLHGTSG